jgi:molecular chaperone GrpE (heat shock protein)
LNITPWSPYYRGFVEQTKLVNVRKGFGLLPLGYSMVEPENEPGTSESMESDVPAGTIVGEERRGYTLDGKILRYAEIIVAKNE